jgi:hypothetical protein
MGGYCLVQVAQAALAKRGEYILRLEAYYNEVAPEKMEEVGEGWRKMVEDTVDKYKDKEFRLWNALERKYGVFPKVLPKGYDGNSQALYPDVFKNLGGYVKEDL